jgi:hypothetical protein
MTDKNKIVVRINHKYIDPKIPLDGQVDWLYLRLRLEGVPMDREKFYNISLPLKHRFAVTHGRLEWSTEATADRGTETVFTWLDQQQ